MIKSGDILRIRKEWQDKGEEQMRYVAIEDEDGGRVRIMELDSKYYLSCQEIVQVYMVEHEDGLCCKS